MPDMVDRPDVVRDNPNVKKYHSTFPLKEVRMTTEQFGLLKPHFVIDDVSTDDFEYRPQYRTRSYTLKAPLMQDVHRKLTYVKVDLSSILPLNFEKFFTNPVQGDDVPTDVGVSLASGYDKIYDAVLLALSSSLTVINGANNFTPSNLTRLLKSLVFGELFYSRGSLLSSLGCHISKQFTATYNSTDLSYDKFFDHLCSNIVGFLQGHSVSYFSGSIDGTSFVCNVRSPYGGQITFRNFLNKIRDTGNWSISSFDNNVSISADFSMTYSFTGSYSSDVPFNYGRVCAYQLACAEYMTNDKVDHIYSAELYRQYIGSLCRSYIVAYLGGSSYPNYFTYNGVSYQYDLLSSHYLSVILVDFLNHQGVIRADFLQFFISLFGYRRSLRYKDYFVSSRVRPLAVGSVDVAVNNNAVSVIDISRNIQMQRFLNAVNHAGRRLSNYIKTFFGANIAPDRHVPNFLAQIDELVYTAEVENTGVAQQTNANSVTATFTGNSSNKQLHFYADLPGYIIGITGYDIERAYCDTIDRSFFIEDRFDMFLPEMQFVGDQPIYAQELDSSDVRSYGSAFGYQYRDMQYKLLYAQADGGFVENLPGYAFMYNSKQFYPSNISPNFIRSEVSELDDFYLSLTGYSLGSYFHFISIIVNNVYAKRPMIANPKILE